MISLVTNLWKTDLYTSPNGFEWFPHGLRTEKTPIFVR